MGSDGGGRGTAALVGFGLQTRPGIDHGERCSFAPLTARSPTYSTPSDRSHVSLSFDEKSLDRESNPGSLDYKSSA